MTNRQAKALSLVSYYSLSGVLLPSEGTITLDKAKELVSEQLEHLTHAKRVSELEYMGYRVGKTEQAVKNKHTKVLAMAFLKYEGRHDEFLH